MAANAGPTFGVRVALVLRRFILSGGDHSQRAKYGDDDTKLAEALHLDAKICWLLRQVFGREDGCVSRSRQAWQSSWYLCFQLTATECSELRPPPVDPTKGERDGVTDDNAGKLRGKAPSCRT